jgi:hypothetical protein
VVPARMPSSALITTCDAKQIINSTVNMQLRICFENQRMLAAVVPAECRQMR